MADYHDTKLPNASDTKLPGAIDDQPVALSDDTSSLGKGDVLGQEHVDPVLNAKMHMVNNAIDEIGMTPYQWKLFVRHIPEAASVLQRSH